MEAATAQRLACDSALLGATWDKQWQSAGVGPQQTFGQQGATPCPDASGPDVAIPAVIRPGI